MYTPRYIPVLENEDSRKLLEFGDPREGHIKFNNTISEVFQDENAASVRTILEKCFIPLEYYPA